MRYLDLLQEDVHQTLASKILDILTPIASNGIQYVTVDQVIKKVQSIPTGMKIDRQMIMDILDPNKFPLVKKIEGDKLYLQSPIADRSVNDAQKDKEADKIKNDAAQQAVKAVKAEI